MSLPVIVLGGGGHAKVLIDALKLCGTRIIGVVDPAPHAPNAAILGVPVLGGDEVVYAKDPSEVLLVNALGTVTVSDRRRQLFAGFKQRGFSFASVIHPSSVVAADAVLGEGVQIMAGAVLQAGCRIGENSIVNTRASLDHDCLIGPHVHISPGVTLSGQVVVGEGSHIGTGATVIQGMTIGEGCLVAAGAVVVKPLKAGARARGVPAREFA